MLFFIVILVQECFTIKLPSRIHGGFDAKCEEYPYIVRIEEQNTHNYTNNTVITSYKFSCTASALSPIWIISAAHCLRKKYPIIRKGIPHTVKKRVIRYGYVDSSSSVKDTFSEVLDTVTHPLYIPFDIKFYSKKTRNDIGLVKISPMNIRSYLKISAVDYQSMYGQEAIIGGFGVATKTDTDGRLVSNLTLFLLKPLQLLKVLLAKCDYDMTLVPAFCLAPRCKESTFVCPGDSGGPVMHASGLIALITLGHSRCNKKFTRVDRVATAIPVSPYIEWIYSYINA